MDQTRVPAAGTDPVRVYLVCSHGLERSALRHLLEDEGLAVVGATGTVQEALAEIPVLLPDVALVDTRVQGDLWITVCRKIWDESPSVGCVTLGSLGIGAELRGAVLAGARAHAVRTVLGDDLVNRIRAVAAGEEDLTRPQDRAALNAELGPWAPGASRLGPEDRRILFLCVGGASDSRIAQTMGLEEHRFPALLRSALGKLGYAPARGSYDEDRRPGSAGAEPEEPALAPGCP